MSDAVIPVIGPGYSGDRSVAGRWAVGETGLMASDVDGEFARALLRAAPPAEALAWLARAADARSVDVVERMPGGISLAMHRVTISLGDGTSVRLVLRRFVRPEQISEDPGVAAHEAAVLELVAPIATPTPRLIAVDPTGGEAGTPAVLMTELAGRPDWSGGQRWMRQLIEILDDVHGIDSGTAAGVRPFAVYQHDSCTLPKWVTKPAVWERAIELAAGPVLDDDSAFIHRDFYPGNVLWHRRSVSGLVDWESASVGPRSMDVAHCRINLLYQGLDAEDIFTRMWERHTGRTFHPWADIATIIGLLDVYRRHPPSARDRTDIEAMLDRAIHQIDPP